MLARQWDFSPFNRKMIAFAYDLEKEDYLNFQLYTSSTDENFIKQRKKERYRISLLTLIFGCVLFFEDGYRLYSYCFLGTSVLYFLFYSWWAAWYYKRAYRQQIEQHFKDSLPYHMEVSLVEDSVSIRTAKGSRRIEASQLSSITEIKDYFFVEESVYSTAIIIPKEPLQDAGAVRTMLMSYAESFNIEYSSNLDWEWK